MKKLSVLSSISAFVLLLAGCAPAKIYMDNGLTRQSGLKYYTQKPVLQVERDPVSKAIVKADVIYLPDLSNPYYLILKGGLGSRKLDLKLKEGSISELGLTTDTKIPESIEAVATLLGKSAEAVKDIASLENKTLAASAGIIEFYDIVMTDTGMQFKKIDF